MQKIALFIRSLKDGGAEKQSILIAEYLRERYDIRLIVYHFSGAYIRLAEEKKINIVPVRFIGVFKVVHFIYICARWRPVLLVSFLPINNILGGLFFKITGVRYFIGGIRGTKIKKSKIKMILSKYICNKRSTLFISNSEAGKESYIKYGFRSDKITVIPNCIEIRKNAPPLRNSDKIYILSVGRLVVEKDYTTALDAIALLIGKNVELKISYHIVGYGALYKKLMILIAEKEMGSHVFIHTDIDYKNIGAFYEKADIFLITSRFEGMPNTVMEAMDNYLPVVGTKAGDIEKLIIHDKNGFLAGIGDVEFIQLSLNQLSTDRYLRERFGNFGKMHLAKNYSVGVVGKQYTELIDSLI